MAIFVSRMPSAKMNSLPAGIRSSSKAAPEPPVCGISGPEDWVWQSITSFSFFFSGAPVKDLGANQSGASESEPLPRSCCACACDKGVAICVQLPFCRS
jgi:hypothetical protein